MTWDFVKNNDRNKLPKQSKFDASSQLEGKLISSETIIIEGRFKGEILVKGSLEITQNAEINGDIQANKLSISGKVTGNINVADNLLVEKTAIIQGDIKAGAAAIIQGAIIHGQCSIGGTADS